jgi:hypothetical protein
MPTLHREAGDTFEMTMADSRERKPVHVKGNGKGGPRGALWPVMLIALGVMLLPLITGCVSPATGSLTILSASSLNPAPLTVDTLKVQGLTPNSLLLVHISNGNGLNQTDTALSESADGQVAIAIPFDLNPKAGILTPGPVTVSLVQNGQQSPPFQLSIGDLPTYTSPDLPLGSISHAYLIYSGLLLGRRINELQAIGIKFQQNLRESIAPLQQQLALTLAAAQEVAKISANPALVIGGDHLANGQAVTFNRATVQTMDSIFGEYLIEQFGHLVPQPAAASAPGGPGDIILVAYSETAVIAVLKELKTYIDLGPNAYYTAKDIQKSDNWTENNLALLKGAVTFFDQAYPKVLDTEVGALLSIFDIAASADNAALDLGALMVDSYYGNDPVSLRQDLAELQSDQLKLWESSWGTFSFGFLQGTTAANADGPFKGKNLGVALSVEAKWLLGFNDEAITAVTAGLFKNPFPARAGIATYQGTTTLPLDSTGLCCMGAAPNTLSGLNDVSGKFELLVPQGVAGVDYSYLTQTERDPITGALLFQEAIGLSEGPGGSEVPGRAVPPTPLPVVTQPRPVVTQPRVTQGLLGAFVIKLNSCPASEHGYIQGYWNCTGTVTVRVNGTISNHVLAVFMAYPGSGSFYHGEEAVSAPGTYVIPITNQFQALGCHASVSTSVAFFNGPFSGPRVLIVSAPVTMKKAC